MESATVLPVIRAAYRHPLAESRSYGSEAYVNEWLAASWASQLIAEGRFSSAALQEMAEQIQQATGLQVADAVALMRTVATTKGHPAHHAHVRLLQAHLAAVWESRCYWPE